MDDDVGSLRPLAQHLPRRTAEGLVFALPDREVTVGGDPDAAWAVIELCDGVRTVDQIVALADRDDAAGSGAKVDVEDARELLTDLLRAGALCDCTQAYRLFHQRGSAGSPLFRILDEAELAALEAETYSPPSRLGDPVPLTPAPSPVLDLAARRASSRPGEPRAVSFAELSTLLAAAYGGAGERRAVPSAGGLYPLIVHAVLRKPLGPLAPGIWWFDPAASALERVSELPGELDSVVLPHPVASAILAAGQPVVFVSADLERPSRKYANRGYRYAMMDAGAAIQAAYLAAAGLELPIRAVGGIHDRLAAELLGLGPDQAALVALLLGR